jgi:hypothetical protein
MADGFKSVRKHRWFKGLDWAAFHSRQVAVPFVPVFKGEDDTRCAKLGAMMSIEGSGRRETALGVFPTDRLDLFFG